MNDTRERAKQYSAMLSALAIASIVVFSCLALFQCYIVSQTPHIPGGGQNHAAIVVGLVVILGYAVSGVTGWIVFTAASIGLSILSERG